MRKITFSKIRALHGMFFYTYANLMFTLLLSLIVVFFLFWNVMIFREKKENMSEVQKDNQTDLFDKKGFQEITKEGE